LKGAGSSLHMNDFLKGTGFSPYVNIAK
jgi:hypothetical protein